MEGIHIRPNDTERHPRNSVLSGWPSHLREGSGSYISVPALRIKLPSRGQVAYLRQPLVTHTVHCTSHSYGLAWCFRVPIYLWQQEEGKRIGSGSTASS